MLVMFWGLMVTGCGTVQQAVAGLDPGLLSSQEATISGSVSYDPTTGLADINLNSIIVSGETLDLGASKFNVYIGRAGVATSEWNSIDISLPSIDNRPMDMVFILDRTGSMGDEITAAKNSIVAFASTLEAAGADVRFGVVAYGDYSSESSSLDLTSEAETVYDFLASVSAYGGDDYAENPLDAIVEARDNFSWRSGSQRVYIVITDAPCHQTGDGGQGGSSTDITTWELSTIRSALVGNSTVYTVSPSKEAPAYGSYEYWKSYIYVGNGDVRDLADGLGCFFATDEANVMQVTQRTTPVPHTGGKWVLLPAGGDVDLNELGISAAVTAGYTLRFSYSFSAGVWFIHVLADTNNDGVMDSDVVFELQVDPVGGAIVRSTNVSAVTKKTPVFEFPPIKKTPN
jgi:hypothetical protein